MKLLNRIKFVFKYDIGSVFIVVPRGGALSTVQFTDYDEAEKFCNEQPLQYGKPSILVAVRKKR